jgi:GxxExxY protein
MDLVVENTVIVEVKAIENLAKVHEVQLLSYLRLHKKSLGLLINFHVPILKHGIRRIVNEFKETSASPRLCVEALFTNGEKL